MAHPEMEAPNAPAPVSVDEKAADFENFLFGDEEEGEEDIETEAEEVDELDDLEEEDQEDEADEPEVPAIEAPVSLNAEEKEVFAQLPPEAQQAWAASETRRNTQVQEATTKASNAQREAESRAAAADAQARRQYADQLDKFVAQYEPQAPNPQLAQQNPQAYIAQEAQYRAMKAQHDEIVQQVKAFGQEADQEAQQAFVQQRDRELMQIPEIANPETRDGFIKRAMSVAEELGYDLGELSQGMNARDLKALAYVADLKDKASKYDKAMSRQMQKVRSAKGKSLRPNAAPQGKSRAASADQSWKRVKSAGSKAQQESAMAEWLEASGHL